MRITMQDHDCRTMLISRSKFAPRRQWLSPRPASHRLMFVESFSAIRFALAPGVDCARIEAVIIDGTATGAEYLHFLCTLPEAYAGDILLLLDGSALLSSTGI